jgi:hypothetical protein
VVLGAAGILGTAWALVSLGRGEYLTVLVAGGAAVFGFSMVAMIARVGTRNVSVCVDVGDDGTTFRPDRRVDVYLMVATVGMWAAMVLYAIFAPLEMVEIPLPRGDRNYLIGTAVVGALVGLPSVRQILVRRGMSFVRLSADGVETGNTYSTVCRRWDDVADVSGAPAHRRRPINTGSTYITTTDGGTRLVASDWYTPGGYALRDLVRFYWQHPDCRDELVDGRVVKRLRGAM